MAGATKKHPLRNSSLLSTRYSSTPMHDIITIGSATRDIFTVAKGADIHRSPHSVSGKEACLPLGAKIDIDKLILETGGGATNTAVSFARLGMRVAALCRVGNDYAGEEIKRVLRREGVDTRLASVDPKTQTTHSIILLTPTGDRTILVYRGASSTMRPSSIPWNKLKSPWIYISSLGGNLNLLSRILKTASAQHIQVAWNPGGKEISVGIKKLLPLIRRVDVLIMNEEEAMTLLSQKPLSFSPFSKGRESSSSPFGKGGLRGILKTLRLLPRRALAITQSERGALVADANQTLHAPALKVKTINTTGAGDAFSAGFITGLWKWNNLSLALRLGILNSGMCVTKMGAKRGLLPRLPSKARLSQIPVMEE